MIYLRKTVLSVLLMFSLIFAVSNNVLSLEARAGGTERIEVLIGFEKGSDTQLVERFGGEIDKEFSLVNAASATIPVHAIEALAKNPNVRYIEPNFEVTAYQETIPWGIDRVFGDETYVFDTWSFTRGDGISVAVLDTGIDVNHPDLNVAGGVTTVDDTFWGSDVSGHGTHVAGTIAALDNGQGVVGVAPNVALFAVKVLSDSGSGSVASVVAGIEWAVAQGIDVVNMSLGSSSSSITLEEASNAAYAAGTLLIASAGNSGRVNGRGDTVGYPAKYESVVAVASSTVSDTRSSFSSTGPAVEIIAPGSNILSTLPGGGYGTMSGTSMASPHVAGIAALVWSANLDLTNVEVRAILSETAEDLGLSAEHQGSGMARADLAVRAALNDEVDPGEPSEPDPEPDPDPEEPSDLEASVSTDSSAYGSNSWVYINVQANQANASVSVNVYSPNGAVYETLSGTTDSNGFVQFRVRITRQSSRGTYLVEATVLKDGQSVITSASFDVQ